MECLLENPIYDNRKAKNELDYYTRDIIESIKDTIIWIKSHKDIYYNLKKYKRVRKS